MTTTQSFKIYELLQSYSIDKNEAQLMTSEIEQVLEQNNNNDISIKKNEIIFNKLNLLKLQLERGRKSNKKNLGIVCTILGIIIVLLSIIKLFIIK